ncbi:DUF3304 domain-containing protein [Chromobacterium violaceum]|uniref:DUF3304 domain-containing protein n=1 Tax=Chromobacterium violaceum TaxID=536 RepID=UPI000E1A89E2|nr:DUF3304 domain-containing protein [Chromobacterium violaceum]SUX89096.1 Protein of uncharacterised function (DUF3304) [Chromobacterium violaceum]
MDCSENYSSWPQQSCYFFPMAVCIFLFYGITIRQIRKQAIVSTFPTTRCCFEKLPGINQMRTIKPYRLLPRFAWLTVILLLSACDDATTAISYLSVNHTEKPIDSVTVNDQGGVLNVPPMGGGGGEVCCVVVPKKWRPGLTAKIGWLQGGHYQRDANGNLVMRNGDKIFIEGTWKTRTVAIPEYQEKDAQHFDIHFLPNDQVLVKLSDIMPYHPAYRPAYPKNTQGDKQ